MHCGFLECYYQYLGSCCWDNPWNTMPTDIQLILTNILNLCHRYQNKEFLIKRKKRRKQNSWLSRHCIKTTFNWTHIHRKSLRKSTNILQKIINNYCNDLNLSTARSITYSTHAFQGNIIADPFIGWKRQLKWILSVLWECKTLWLIHLIVFMKIRNIIRCQT